MFGFARSSIYHHDEEGCDDRNNDNRVILSDFQLKRKRSQNERKIFVKRMDARIQINEKINNRLNYFNINNNNTK